MTFKRKDVQKCLLCDKGIAHNQFNPTFFRITLERFILDFPAIQREGGVEASLGGGQGGAVLAGIMGTDPDLAHTLPSMKSFLVCGFCAGLEYDPEDSDDETPGYTIKSLADMVFERDQDKKDSRD